MPPAVPGVRLKDGQELLREGKLDCLISQTRVLDYPASFEWIKVDKNLVWFQVRGDFTGMALGMARPLGCSDNFS